MERKKDYILCVVSAVIGIVIFAVAGINKRITFCDEVYTYMIVNSSNAAYQFADGEWSAPLSPPAAPPLPCPDNAPGIASTALSP